MFQSNGSLPIWRPSFLRRVPSSAVPRHQRSYRGAERTLAHSRSLMASVTGRTRASCVRARRSAPGRRGGRRRACNNLWAGVPSSGLSRPWTRAGPHRFPGDPSHAFALLQDPGRAEETSPLAVSSMLPPGSTNRRPQRVGGFQGLTQGFSIRCLRFTSNVAATHAKLASGWRAAPLPGGRRTLWTATKGFRSHFRPLFQGLACREWKMSRKSTLSGIQEFAVRIS